MIKEYGIIENVLKDKAVIRLQKSSACAHCESQGSCEVATRDILVEVSNDLHAAKGDTVEVSMPEGAILKISALVYIFPIMALMVGAFLGGLLSGPIRTDQSLTAVVGGGIFMVMAFYVLKRFEQTKRSGNNSIYPRMTRIMVSADSLQHGDSR
ncbi:MAG: SoxR reducing system RseC family protein [Deltaproteobacteria bacterium]|nr:SoxR reducing system RseC family protein [Deltaproteobacteria bacterium]